MRPANSNSRHKTIDEQITEFFSNGGEIQKIKTGSGATNNGLTKREYSDTQKRKKKNNDRIRRYRSFMDFIVYFCDRCNYSSIIKWKKGKAENQK